MCVAHARRASSGAFGCAGRQAGNSCRYGYAGVRALLWLQGMSRARIQRMKQERAERWPHVMAAGALARSQSRAGLRGARATREHRLPRQK